MHISKYAQPLKEVSALQHFDQFHLPDSFLWDDSSWLMQRSGYQVLSRPLNIYELHLGSWRRAGDGSFLTFREIAYYLVPYVKELGFTHVELLPVSEYEEDASWGYRCTDPFSVTRRFGSPADFMYLVNELHRAGVGILLDWVCPCSADDLLQNEQTLISSALLWPEHYHIDGLRPILLCEPPATARESVFLQHLNQAVSAACPDVLMIAAGPHLTGAGFPLTWNTNWITRLLPYLRLDPYFRQYNHENLTVSRSPAEEPPAILPLSHDEIVHNKGSLLNKMPGSDPEKFASVRAFYSYMLAYPGKKLTMMGCEFGQWDEWHYDRSLDWHLLEQQSEDGLRHRQLRSFFKAANAFYLKTPALWQLDFSSDGFRWICSDDASANTVSFLRFDKQGRFSLIVSNFSPVFREHYRIGVPEPGQYEEVFTSDLAEFGGENRRNPSTKSENIPCHGMTHSLQVNLPPLSTVILQHAGTRSDKQQH